MKFWVYLIDWRTMAVTILAEVKTEYEAKLFDYNYMLGMKPEELVEFTKFKTIGTTPVSREMELAVVPFRHKGQAVGV